MHLTSLSSMSDDIIIDPEVLAVVCLQKKPLHTSNPDQDWIQVCWNAQKSEVGDLDLNYEECGCWLVPHPRIYELGKI